MRLAGMGRRHWREWNTEATCTGLDWTRRVRGTRCPRGIVLYSTVVCVNWYSSLTVGYSSVLYNMPIRRYGTTVQLIYDTFVQLLRGVSA